MATLLLSACASSTPAPDPAQPALPDEQAVPAAALAFHDALESRDFAAAVRHATTAAGEYFALEAEFFAMLDEDFGDEEPPVQARVGAVEVDGDAARVELLRPAETRDGPAGDGDSGDGAAEDRSMWMLLSREAKGWGVYALQTDLEMEPVEFASRVPQVRERLDRARAELQGDPQLAPLVAAWIEAVTSGDFAAAEKLLTPECVQREAEFERSFTTGFRSGEIRMHSWKFSGHNVEGDEGRQRVRCVLQLKNGEFDGEPIRFDFVRTAAGWRIAEIS